MFMLLFVGVVMFRYDFYSCFGLITGLVRNRDDSFDFSWYLHYIKKKTEIIFISIVFLHLYYSSLLVVNYLSLAF